MSSFEELGDSSAQLNPFGAGVKRKPIVFVPESQAGGSEENSQPSRLGDRYLDIVLKKKDDAPSRKDALSATFPLERDTPQNLLEDVHCAICGLLVEADDKPSDALTVSHDLSVAHQVCLEHSYPPSHLDRQRQGVKYLAAHGWNVDGRKGLGVNETGRLAPVKAKTKDNTVGLGMEIPQLRKDLPKPVLLDAGKARIMHDANRRKHEKLQRLFYQDDEVSRYLGED